MMPRPAAPALILAALVVCGLSANKTGAAPPKVALPEARVVSARFEPARFSIGQEARLILELRDNPLAQAPVVIDFPRGDGSLELKRARLDRRSASLELSLDFVAYDYRPQHPSPLEIGGLLVRLPEIVVEPLADSGAARLRPSPGVEALPGFGLRLCVGLGLLAATLAFALFAWRGGGALLRRLVAGYRARLPSRRFLAALSRIESKKALSAQEFYDRLSRASRAYLSRRLGTRCAALTSAELLPVIGAALRSVNRPTAPSGPALASTEAEVAALSEGLEAALAREDLARFAAQAVADTERRVDLGAWKALARSLSAAEEGE
jgi:hypothetical protein